MIPKASCNKLIVSVVNKEDAGPLLDVLVRHGYRATALQSAGGFLRKENMTVLAGVEDGQVNKVIRLIQENCHTRIQRVASLPSLMESGEVYVLDTEEREVKVGGAVIFVLDVAQFLKT
jgi:uncharacterized protein YaaQ